jgi:hypothetical protein
MPNVKLRPALRVVRANREQRQGDNRRKRQKAFEQFESRNSHLSPSAYFPIEPAQRSWLGHAERRGCSFRELVR